MIVFVSPDAILSNWLYFESGFAYSKGIRVVPVGFLGVDLSQLSPPLSLLQGFNIKSEAGLNNIIALTNQVFRHSHPETFTGDEFREVCGTTKRALQTFGDKWNLVDELRIELSQWSGLDCSSSKALEKIQRALELDGMAYERSESAINIPGITFHARVEAEEEPLQIRIDPGLVDVTLPIVERSIRAVRSRDGVRGIAISIDLDRAVDSVRARHKITGRVYGTDVSLGSGEYLIRREIQFRIGRLAGPIGRTFREGPAFIQLEMLADRIPSDQIRELILFLFDRDILFVPSDIRSQ